MGTNEGARVIHPGDPDHPAEQVRAAGAEGSQPSLVASYSIDVTLRQASAYVAGDPAKSHVLPDAIVEEDPLTLRELKIAELEGVLKTALEDYGYTVHVEAKRTDK